MKRKSERKFDKVKKMEEEKRRRFERKYQKIKNFKKGEIVKLRIEEVMKGEKIKMYMRMEMSGYNKIVKVMEKEKLEL